MYKASGCDGVAQVNKGIFMRFSLGIDVSKAKLDCMLLDTHRGKRKAKSVNNNRAGVAALLEWCVKNEAMPQELLAVLEPTGVYHEAAALALVDAQCQVALVNPLHLRRFAQSLGVVSKTDALDSAMLARFGQERRPARWVPPSQAVRHLHSLLSRCDALHTDLQREQNRQSQAELSQAPELVLESLKQSIEHLQNQLEQLKKSIDQHIDGDSGLREKRDLLRTIPGVGAGVAHRFTALLGDARFHSAEQLAAYLGLVPMEWESGSSVRSRPRLSKRGPSAIRGLIYLPAIVAKRWNPHVKAVYERLLAKGKCKMAAIGAAMRKLVHLCFGVVKSGKPYDPGMGLEA